MNDPQFRIASESDLGVLLAMMRELNEEDHDVDQPPFDSNLAGAAAIALIENSSWGRVWMICDDERVVGYLALTFGYSLEYGGRDAFVDELFIAPSHRNLGMGRKALLFAEAASPALGIKALHLEVKRGNDAAQRLYRSLGFNDHVRRIMTKCVA